MNPTTEQPPQAAPPLQPHRSSFSCDKHPTEQFTGFCPSCLCERLCTLDQSSASSSRRPSNAAAPSTAAAALKAIFRVPASTALTDNNSSKSKNKPPSASSSSSFFPELRRTKSFSASKNEGFSGVFEPQRKSCDVRGRSTLWSLFNLDEQRKSSFSVEVEARNSVSSGVTGPVLESKEEEDDEEEELEDDPEEEIDSSNDEIKVAEEPNVDDFVLDPVGKIVEEEEMKTMKDHIDLDSQAKKNSSGRDLKEIAGSFWSAASVFSKKWHNWRRKQKMKKRNTGGESAALPVEKPISRQYRETQSEIADYGYGRRSCDTEPRFSIDIGRMSLDDPRYSFDEPRASWDGYLIGRSFPRLPPMHSLVEDAPVVPISRIDTQIPVEQPPIPVTHEEETPIPGGSAQTREYYSDTSSRRRKSLDRSNSIRKTAAAVVAEIDEMKAASNAKVSPATIDCVNGVNGARLSVGERDFRDYSNCVNGARLSVGERGDLRDYPNCVNGARLSVGERGDLRDYPNCVNVPPRLSVGERDFRDYQNSNCVNGARLSVGERDLRDYSNSNSLRDDCSETFELGFRDNATVVGNGELKGGSKKSSRRWSKAWNIWGFIHRRSGGNNKDEEERYSSRSNGVERSFSESWQDSRGGGGGGGGVFNRKVLRSNSSVSWRNSSYNFGGSFGSVKNGGFETNGTNGKKKKEEFVLERNRSARYSPNHVDNGLLKLYLTPMRSGSRRGGAGLLKSKPNNSHSIARSVLRLY